MPSGEVSSDQIEDIYAMLNEMGIAVETEDADNDAEDKAGAATTTTRISHRVVETRRSRSPPPRKSPRAHHDPVRMYLREMASVSCRARLKL
jgi:RNA polymerase primary sigma factor